MGDGGILGPGARAASEPAAGEETNVTIGPEGVDLAESPRREAPAAAVVPVVPVVPAGHRPRMRAFAFVVGGLTAAGFTALGILDLLAGPREGAAAAVAPVALAFASLYAALTWMLSRRERIAAISLLSLIPFLAFAGVVGVSTLDGLVGREVPAALGFLQALLWVAIGELGDVRQGAPPPRRPTPLSRAAGSLSVLAGAAYVAVVGYGADPSDVVLWGAPHFVYAGVLGVLLMLCGLRVAAGERPAAHSAALGLAVPVGILLTRIPDAVDAAAVEGGTLGAWIAVLGAHVATLLLLLLAGWDLRPPRTPAPARAA